MIVGVPKEIKEHEYRIALTPSGIEALRKDGHRVVVEEDAGIGSGITNEEIREAGGEILPSHEEVFTQAGMIVKVKEPLREECELLREGQILFTYLHLASNKTLTRSLMKAKVIATAYETVETNDGKLPLLIPMSEVAGRLAIQEGAKYLEKPQGGEGILLGGVPGVTPAKVVILGGGVVGTNAAKMAAGLGARVLILTPNLDRLRYLDDVMQANVITMKSNEYNIRQAIKDADLVVGAVLVPGGKAPHLISRKMLKTMKPGSVIVDVAIDQGGCVETSRPTSHSEPIYEVEGIIHYCVTNMPGCVSQTSTYALTNATLPYVLELANNGYPQALREDKALAKGLNIVDGKVTYEGVAKAHGLPCHPLEEVLG
jgi:alanine dehydrogenase